MEATFGMEEMELQTVNLTQRWKTVNIVRVKICSAKLNLYYAKRPVALTC